MGARWTVKSQSSIMHSLSPGDLLQVVLGSSESAWMGYNPPFASPVTRVYKMMIYEYASMVVTPYTSAFAPTTYGFEPSVVNFQPMTDEVTSPSAGRKASSTIFMCTDIAPSTMSYVSYTQTFEQVSAPFFSDALHALSTVSQSSHKVGTLPPSDVIALLPGSTCVRTGSDPVCPPPAVVE